MLIVGAKESEDFAALCAASPAPKLSNTAPQIVHNRYVVEELSAKGAIFVDNVDEVPAGERVIYSAHGVAPKVREASKDRNLRVIDATCPLVTKVHVEAIRFAKEGYSLILIGHRDHD